jgi:hypothetical protein
MVRIPKTKSIQAQCMELWKKAINKRDKVCQRPGCPHCFNQPGVQYLQAHHIVKRTNWPLRYDLSNGVLLCRPSHKYWAHDDDPFIQEEVHEFYKKFTNWDYLKASKHRQSKNDYNLIFMDLLSYVEDGE